MSKSEVEIKYEEYLKSDEKTKIINGKKHYKVVYSFVGEYFGMLIIPFGAVPKYNVKVIDENGFEFHLKGLMHIRFSGGIPDWYLKVAAVGIDVVEPNKIGNYIRHCEE